MACGKDMRRDADDFLLYGAEDLIQDSREGQVTMARAVEETIRDNNALLVEGPVGVGKSFAYLLPALLSRGRTVVSTAQKALQFQLAGSDGPRLLDVLKADVPGATVALLKGKNNYGCLLHTELTADVPGFAAWLGKSETADLSEYRGQRPARIADVTAEGCIGKRCPQAAACGYQKTREAASKASVLVANHSLTAFDLRFGPMKVLGNYRTLIVDEAHKAPSSFRSAFEESLSSGGAIRILKPMDALEHVKFSVDTKSVAALWKEAFSRAGHLEGAIGPSPFGSVGTQLYASLEILRGEADKALGVLNRAHVENLDVADIDPTLNLELSDLNPLVQLTKALHRATSALHLLEEPTANTLLTAEKSGRVHRFKATPISVGALLGDKLKTIPSLIFTSATMTTNGSFADFRRQLGLNRLETAAPAIDDEQVILTGAKAIQELVVPSPFNYKTQGAFLYIPKHVHPAVSESQGTPETRQLYLDSIANETHKLVHVAGGNALILFTSTADLREVYTRLKAKAPKIPWIVQDADSGEGAEAVLARFRETTGGVILGLKSFWEGVSVEGDKLWLVVVTKLPFPSPSDPLLQAQAAQLEEELLAQGVDKKDISFATFRKLSLPPMLTDLRQGAGRLIRTKTDRGVLAILDVRMWTNKVGVAPDPAQAAPKGYANTVVAALGFTGNYSSNFGLVASRFAQWRK